MKKSKVTLEVAEIRGRTGLSQEDFAILFGVPVRTLRNWEQSVRHPTGAAVTLLCLTEIFPKGMFLGALVSMCKRTGADLEEVEGKKAKEKAIRKRLKLLQEYLPKDGADSKSLIAVLEMTMYTAAATVVSEDVLKRVFRNSTLQF